MTPLKLTSWFRARMIPLVLLSSLIAAAAAPIAYHVLKRRELYALARRDAEKVTSVLGEVVQLRPTLWRYDVAKITERLSSEGLKDAASLVVHDARGVAVPIEIGVRPTPKRLIWVRSEVANAGSKSATIWVAVDAAPLWFGTLVLAALGALVSTILGTMLYLVPTRAIGSAEQRIALLMGRLTLTMQEEERRRIARDLHDGAGQALTAARLQLLSLRKKGTDPEIVDSIAVHLDEALDEVRRSTTALMPPALAELGLPGALQRHCEAFSGATGLEVDCRTEDDLPKLAPHVEIACYRIVQEALNNTARHSKASRATVSLDAKGDRLRLAVGDDGGGMSDADDSGSSSGTGFASIRERARLIGGEATIERVSGGLRIEVTVPLAGVEA